MENHERHKMIANFWEITYRLEVLVWRKTILQKHPCESLTDITTNVYRHKIGMNGLRLLHANCWAPCPAMPATTNH
jgi:hypothetical protein